ncbi:hypothetical protein [Phytoactinopolyspora endophytica]|uniref:hypothetical protein n=1 Tax=Phytoactinopolyspora endophytica TaxID=1642495 RepID=UPI0013ED7FD2|nr:hypothetical protein [Phytoactinopolyspora endophytica]
MRPSSSPGRAQTVRLRDAGPNPWHYLPGLMASGFVCLLFVMPLSIMAADEIEPGNGVWTVLWQSEFRALTISALVTGAVVAALLVVALVRLPRALAARAVVVDVAGFEAVERPRWWFRGRQARIAWEDVQVISAEDAGHGSSDQSPRTAQRLLDLYLTRDVPGVPPFVAVTRVDEPDVDIEGVRVPSYRARIQGLMPRSAMDVQELAEAVGSVRPDLFYAGIRVDQWYMPPPDARAGATGRSGAGRAVAGVDTDAISRPSPQTLRRPGAPVRLDYRHPSWQIVGTIFGQIAAIAGCWYLMNNPFGWSTVPAGLLALLLVTPFLFCCGTLPAALWIMPRYTARVGIEVGPLGLTVTRKRPWRLRATVSTDIAWDRVQAVVARGSSGTAAPSGKRRRSVDIYLHDGRDEPYPVPGVGTDMSVSRRLLPDSSGTDPLVAFPATRLRLTYRHDLEPRGRQRWESPDGPGPDTLALPPYHLRPALLAFRPERCHGFDDLWSGIDGH